MNNCPIFIMPLKLNDSEMELKFFRETVESIKNQTDTNWQLVIIEDYSNVKSVYDELDKLKAELKDKLHIIYSDKNYGTGAARNRGIAYAHEVGAPFILYNDADDISDPRRLELVRKAFEDKTVNVVYTSFDVIDEYGNVTPEDKLSLVIKEIIDGHHFEPVEGERAWINIAIKKKYTNLTSCTAVRTELAFEEKFPESSISEDCHTWFRYGAHPGKFVLLKDIIGHYRIRLGTASRSRSLHADFYERMMEMDSSGFESALQVAKKYGTMGGYDENELRAAFHVRLALNLLHAGSEQYAKESLKESTNISKEITLKYIDLLQCEPEEKAQLKELTK